MKKKSSAKTAAKNLKLASDKNSEPNSNLKPDKKPEKKPESWREMVKTFVLAGIFAILIRSFLYEPFHIPSSSMKPNLLVGDYIFVSKFGFGYSKYSFPFNSFDLFNGRFFDKHKPERGQVVVFRFPKDPNINYIKRIVGLPGDKIKVVNGQLFINNEAISKVYSENFVDDDGNIIAAFKENIDGKNFLVLDQYQDLPQDNTKTYEVPAGHYFAMGDNRDNSQDSRFENEVGFIPEENLVGPAKIIFFSSAEPIWKIWRWFDSIRLKRIFKVIN